MIWYEGNKYDTQLKNDWTFSWIFSFRLLYKDDNYVVLSQKMLPKMMFFHRDVFRKEKITKLIILFLWEISTYWETFLNIFKKLSIGPIIGPVIVTVVGPVIETVNCTSNWSSNWSSSIHRCTAELWLFWNRMRS